MAPSWGPGGGDKFRPWSVGKVTAAAKAIIARYYGQAREALLFRRVLHRRPRGHAGLAALPGRVRRYRRRRAAMRTGVLISALPWPTRFHADRAEGRSGKPEPNKAFSPADKKLVTDAIVAACDAKDGLKDGMIFNTRQCQFDPASLACSGAKTDACLSRSGERLDEGVRRTEELARRRSPIRHSRGIAASPPGAFPSPAFSPPARAAPSIRHFSRGSMSTRWRIRSTRMEWIGFRHGELDQPQQFLRRAAARFSSITAGQRSLVLGARHGRLLRADGEEFRRLGPGARELQPPFSFPAWGTATGGATLERFDLLQAVVDWVEQDKAPEPWYATGPAFPGRSRPLCAYPQHARIRARAIRKTPQASNVHSSMTQMQLRQRRRSSSE